jgi:hypothetical protein
LPILDLRTAAFVVQSAGRVYLLSDVSVSGTADAGSVGHVGDAAGVAVQTHDPRSTDGPRRAWTGVSWQMLADMAHGEKFAMKMRTVILPIATPHAP